MNIKLSKILLPYIWSLILVALMSLIGEFVNRFLEPTNLVMLYLLAVVISAALWGRGPAVTTALVSVLLFDFLFIPPRLTFTVAQTQYLLTFIGLFMVGIVISELAVQLRQRAKEAQKREAQTTTLFHFNKDLANSHHLEETMQLILFHMKKILGNDLGLYLREGNSFKSRGPQKEYLADEKTEMFLQGIGGVDSIGLKEKIIPDIIVQSPFLFIPLITGSQMIGFLSSRLEGDGGEVSPENRKLLKAMASQAALAIERIKLLEENRQIAILHETEKLHKALLSSISHDLRTPLVSITGALSSLIRDEQKLDPALKQELVETAYEESVRMNKLVSHLLDMARIEAGAVQAHIKPCELREVIALSLEELKEKSADRFIQVNLSQDLIDVPMDFLLMAKVLSNLIDNAIKYSYANSPVAISAQVEDEHLHIKVQNQGEGISRDDLDRVFSKFYRVERKQRIQGTGLGLSICRGIVELHKGKIWIESQPHKETIVHIELPLRNNDV